jgi:hypothetical protein
MGGPKVKRTRLSTDLVPGLESSGSDEGYVSPDVAAAQTGEPTSFVVEIME